MRLNVNPTRMELLKLKKRLVLARRGHQLLKNKQDELMRQFMELVEEIKGLRSVVEDELARAQMNFINARSVMSREHINGATGYPKMETDLEVRYEPLMNLRIPKYELKIKGDYFSYGVATTSMEIDLALMKYREVLPKMIELASKEKTMELLAHEIESTRRRVNALEHILIPNLLETIRYISMKLEELERGNITRLMKIKDIVRAR